MKESIVGELLLLQEEYMKYKYRKEGKNLKINIHLYLHNNEATIKSQIESIASQLYNNINITIENDASSDNSPMFIKYMADKHPGKITIINN